MNEQLNIRVEKKSVSKGAKIRVEIFNNDELIGSRTSARLYRFALVVCHRQDLAIAAARRGVKFNRDQAVEYAAIHSGSPEAFAKANKGNNAWGIECSRRFLAEGKYDQWSKECAEAADRAEARLQQLLSGPLPEFAKPFVLSFHQSRKNVPDVSDTCRVMAIVEIPE